MSLLCRAPAARPRVRAQQRAAEHSPAVPTALAAALKAEATASALAAAGMPVAVAASSPLRTSAAVLAKLLLGDDKTVAGLVAALATEGGSKSVLAAYILT